MAATASTLHSFSGTDGSVPFSELVQTSDGNFFGTTSVGGTHGKGTIFKMSSAGVVTTLYNFAGTDGDDPLAGLTLGSDGNLYGTTTNGGTNNYGTVFQITPAGVLTTLYSFTGNADGGLPWYRLVEGSAGIFYGTTTYGGLALSGSTPSGTVFAISTTGTLTTLHSFSTTGQSRVYPSGLVRDSNGTFFGTTNKGGTIDSANGNPNGFGTVFKITPSGTFTEMYRLHGSDGSNPAGPALGGDGFLYVTTGGPGQGKILKFRTTPDPITSVYTLTTVLTFSGGADGGIPTASLIRGNSGKFYGTTSLGGSGYGTVFEFNQASSTLTTLYSFLTGTLGNPYAALVQGADAGFYGTSQLGGTNNFGFIFKVAVPAADTPTFSPGAGTYTSAQSVTLSDTTANSSIYFTTDGSTPTTASTLYSSPVTISASQTLKAIAEANGHLDSAVASAAYVIQLPAATPTFSPSGGTFSSAQSVAINDSTPGASIRYTNDGSTPTVGSSLYSGPISVSNTKTLKAVAFASGYTASAVASATYTIQIPAASPTFNLASGTYNGAQNITISDSTTGSSIYYTTDGSTPTTSSTPYSGPLTVSQSTPLKAIAIAPGYVASDVTSANYVIVLPAASPTFSPSSGSYSTAQTVTISDATTGAVVHYTTDGSTPTSGSATYTAPVIVGHSQTLQAIAVASGYSSSAVSSASYVITAPQADAPTFSPAGGTYVAAQLVTLSSSTPGAVIHFTADGTTPTASSDQYTGPLAVPSSETIKAIVTASGYSDSNVSSATYSITGTGGGSSGNGKSGGGAMNPALLGLLAIGAALRRRGQRSNLKARLE